MAIVGRTRANKRRSRWLSLNLKAVIGSCRLKTRSLQRLGTEPRMKWISSFSPTNHNLLKTIFPTGERQSTGNYPKLLGMTLKRHQTPHRSLSNLTPLGFHQQNDIYPNQHHYAPESQVSHHNDRNPALFVDLRYSLEEQCHQTARSYQPNDQREGEELRLTKQQEHSPSKAFNKPHQLGNFSNQ